MHGGLSTGARSVAGKQRQAEGRERWLHKLRGQGRKPGPPRGAGGRPRKATVVDPAEQRRLDALAALDTGLPKKRSAPMPDAPEEGRFIEQPAPALACAAVHASAAIIS